MTLESTMINTAPAAAAHQLACRYARTALAMMARVPAPRRDPDDLHVWPAEAAALLVTDTGVLEALMDDPGEAVHGALPVLRVHPADAGIFEVQTHSGRSLVPRMSHGRMSAALLTWRGDQHPRHVMTALRRGDLRVPATALTLHGPAYLAGLARR